MLFPLTVQIEACKINESLMKTVIIALIKAMINSLILCGNRINIYA